MSWERGVAILTQFFTQYVVNDVRRRKGEAREGATEKQTIQGLLDPKRKKWKKGL